MVDFFFSYQKLNGSSVDGFVIRVDMAEPSKHDQSRAVFVGNLPFAIEENDVWNHFKQCGEIQDVRLIRDSSTGIGKGFGYVNFKVTWSNLISRKNNRIALF